MLQPENNHYLEGVEPGDIPSTVDFPIRKILDLYPDQWGFVGDDNWIHHGRGWLWDMGFGPAKKAIQLKRNGFTVGGYDINKKAVVSARRKNADFFGKPGDVRYFGLGEEAMWDTVSWLENVDALLFQAVFPSLLGDDWKNALDSADMMLRPGKYMFIADFMNASHVYHDLFSRKDLLGERTWGESAERWKKRYEVNQLAFGDLGLPMGSFAVAAPGPHKFEYDWSDDPGLLRSLYDIREYLPEGFERFARHIDLQEFINYLVDDLGYEIVQQDLVPRKSRSTTSHNRWTVAPGFELTVKKSPMYKYDPWRYGLNPNNPDTYDVAQRRKGSPYRGKSYDEEYYRNILKRVRPSQKPVFEEMARRVGVHV